MQIQVANGSGSNPKPNPMELMDLGSHPLWVCEPIIATAAASTATAALAVASQLGWPAVRETRRCPGRQTASRRRATSWRWGMRKRKGEEEEEEEERERRKKERGGEREWADELSLIHI